MPGTHEDFDMTSFFDELIDMIYFHESWTVSDLVVKLTEETGEMAEQVLVHRGLKQKEFKEGVDGECADVVNCALAVAVIVMKEQGLEPAEIKRRIYDSMSIKLDKYRNALN